MTARQRKQLDTLAHVLAEDYALQLVDSGARETANNRLRSPAGWSPWCLIYPYRDKTLRQAVRYLELRGILQWHRTSPWIVRMKEAKR